MLGRDRAVVFSPEVTGTLGTARGSPPGATASSARRSLASALSLAEALDLRDT